MIVLSFYGFRRNKFKLFAALLVLFLALGLLFSSMLQPGSTLDALGTEEEQSDTPGGELESGLSAEDGYPGEPQRVLNETGALKISGDPEAYWSAVLDAVSE